MVWDNYYPYIGALPWYWIDGSDRSQFPSATILNEYIDYNYAPYPYGAAGDTTPSVTDITNKVAYGLDFGHGVLACDTSKKARLILVTFLGIFQTPA